MTLRIVSIRVFFFSVWVFLGFPAAHAFDAASPQLLLAAAEAGDSLALIQAPVVKRRWVPGPIVAEHPGAEWQRRQQQAVGLQATGALAEYVECLQLAARPGHDEELAARGAELRSSVLRQALRPHLASRFLAAGDSLAALPYLQSLTLAGGVAQEGPWLELWVRAALSVGDATQLPARHLLPRLPGPLGLQLLNHPEFIVSEQVELLEIGYLESAGHMEEALSRCEEVLAAREDSTIEEARANLLLRLGRGVAGRAAWRRLDREGGAAERAVLSIARSYKADRDTSAAVQAYVELADRFSRWRQRGIWAAVWLEEERGRDQAALTLLDRLLATASPGNLHRQALLHRALLRLDSGDSPGAGRDARRLAAQSPSGPLADAGSYWAWVAGGRPGAPPELSPGSVYAVLCEPVPKVGRVALADLLRWERSRDRLLTVALSGRARARPEFLTMIDRIQVLGDLGWDDWARAECRAAETWRPRSGTEAHRLARAALAVAAVDVYLRTITPRIGPAARAEAERALLLHPLQYLGTVQALAPPGLDPLLACALIEAESAGNPEAVSGAGALGLMQLLPSTAREVALRHGWPPPRPAELLDPLTNIRLGCAHLMELLEHYEGREERAVAAYNAGIAAVDRWERQAPGRSPLRFIDGAAYAETRAYLRRVLAHRAIMWRSLYLERG